MTSVPLSKPPRKKPNVVWLIGGVLVLLIGWFFFQLFGPNPPIIVSRQTTYITEPLRPDGLPDYEKYILEMYRKGVTPENNAAPLLFKATFPSELQQSDYQAVSTALGLATIPSAEDSVQPLFGSTNRERIAAWLADHGQPEADQKVADKVVEEAMKRPWKSNDVPPLALWVQENERPLDLIVEATSRSQCFWPSPTLLNGKKDLLVQMLLPHVVAMREGARELAVRAMWHLGEDRPNEAWRDLLGVHRLARFLAQGQTLVEQRIAYDVDDMAIEGTLNLLAVKHLTTDQARQIEHDLASLSDMTSVARTFDGTERLSTLDCTMFISNVGLRGAQLAFELDQGKPAYEVLLDSVSLDWNFILAEGNRWYDRALAAAQLPDWTARQQAFDQIGTDLHQKMGHLQQPGEWVGGVLSRRKRSQLAAFAVLGLTLPALTIAANEEDRANTRLALGRLAAALAVHGTAQGAYPEKLEALLPDVVPELPTDLYHGQPFVYQRDGEGYLLYCTGENGADDGGSNQTLHILSGRSLDHTSVDELDAETAKIPRGADDIAIRVPRHAFELPKPSSP